MNYVRSLLGSVVLPLLGFLALADTGCATSIASKYPHLERREVCVHLPGSEPDASEYLITAEGAVVSNFHPELVDRIAPAARTVYEFNPAADPSSTRYLPPQYQDLRCDPVFSVLPSKDAETEPLPEAAVDLLVHERRPERIPSAIAEKLATCPTPNGDPSQQLERQVNIIVYVTNDGRAVSAYLAQSTLRDPKTETCMVNALRETIWPEVVANLEAASTPTALPAATMPLGIKTFFAQPAPTLPTPEAAPTSGIRIKPPVLVPTPTAPATNPGGFRIPFVGAFPAIGPLIVGGIVIVGITLLPNSAAPPWLSELNPITRLPYRSPDEFRQINQLSPEEIQRLQTDYIKAAQKKAPPAAAPPPAPVPPPATGTRRNVGQTCDDSVLDELEAAKKAACSTKWTCSDAFENMGKKKEKLLTCIELLPRIAMAQNCLNARELVQAVCYAGSPEAKHEGQVKNLRDGLQECIDKADKRGPGGGPCPR